MSTPMLESTQRRVEPPETGTAETLREPVTNESTAAMSSGRSRKWLAIGGVLVVGGIIGLGIFWPWHGGAQSLQLPGVVEIQEVRLGSKVGGRVEKIATKEGAIVEAGQPLVYFEVPELRAQRVQLQARVAQAQADLERAENGSRKEELAAAQEAMESAKAHYELLKAGSRPEEIQEARSQYESATADLKLAREDWDRAERMFRQGAMSIAEHDSARANRDRAQHQAARTKAHYDMLVAGSRREDIEQAAADYKKAKANYDLLVAGTRTEDIQNARAKLAEARGKLEEIDANLKEAVVRAPERAVVEVLAVRKGDLVGPNQPVVRILRAEDMWVKVYVPETELGKMRLNQEVRVTIDSYPEKVFNGTIMQIASESEFTPRNVQSPDERKHQVFGIKVHVPDPQGIFKSGMAAEVTVPLQE